MCKPKEVAEVNSKHWLIGGGKKSLWYWTGKGWSTQSNSPYYTKAVIMGVLGWKYVEPVEDSE